jgi:hypothetical protein
MTEKNNKPLKGYDLGSTARRDLGSTAVIVIIVAAAILIKACNG